MRAGEERAGAPDLIAVTGGTGFVGSHVVEALLERGYRVRALVRRPRDPGWLKGLASVELCEGDVREGAQLAGLVRGASAVVHVAGKVSARSEDEFQAANAAGTANLVAATLEAAPRAHFVLISSQAAAGPAAGGRAVRAEDEPHPVSAYGRSKLAGEARVRQAAGLRFTVLRPGAVYGPRETAIRDLFVAASRGVVPVLAGGRPKVQMVYVADVAAAVLGALDRGGKGETFFLAHPEVLDYGTIADTLASLPRRRPILLPVPAFAIRAAGGIVGALSRLSGRTPVFDGEKASEMLQEAWLCDVSPAQEALGQPFRTAFRAGAGLTWAWLASSGFIRA